MFSLKPQRTPVQFENSEHVIPRLVKSLTFHTFPEEKKNAAALTISGLFSTDNKLQSVTNLVVCAKSFYAVEFCMLLLAACA